MWRYQSVLHTSSLPYFSLQWRDGITYCNFRESCIINNTHALNTTAGVCHDGVDLSVCFEDSAVLYAICIFLWVFAGLEFLLGRNSIKPKIYFNLLHALKLVRGECMSKCVCVCVGGCVGGCVCVCV